MSWQAYVDDRLVGSGHLDKGAIFDATGQSAWAASPGYNLKPEELKEIVAAFADPGDKDGVKKVQSTGFHAGGDRFVVLRADSRSLYGKKGKEGVIIVKTKQAILLGHHGENVQTPNAALVVEQLADYLISVGY